MSIFAWMYTADPGFAGSSAWFSARAEVM